MDRQVNNNSIDARSSVTEIIITHMQKNGTRPYRGWKIVDKLCTGLVSKKINKRLVP